MIMRYRSRKRIWEIDCLLLDAILASSFSWTELLELLQKNGLMLEPKKTKRPIEFQIQRLIHKHCHFENPISLELEEKLDERYEKTISMFSDWNAWQVAEYIFSSPPAKKESYRALLWVFSSESREGFECIRRHFYRQFQIVCMQDYRERTAIHSNNGNLLDAANLQN